MKKSVSIGDALRFGWQGFKDEAFLWISLVLFTFVVTVGLQALIPCAKGETSLVCSLGYLGIFLVQTYFLLGFTNIALIQAGGGTPTFGDFFMKLPLIFHMVVAYICFIFAFTVGLILFIAPGLIWGVKFSMYPFLVVEKHAFGPTALSLSSTATDGVKWDLLGFFAVIFLLQLAGALALGLGLFVTIPLYWLSFAYVYKRLTEDRG